MKTVGILITVALTILGLNFLASKKPSWAAKVGLAKAPAAQ